MKWSFKLGRILGIDVYVHFTFLLLLGFVGLAHWLPGRSLEAALTGVLFFAGLFVCVLLHEYGHALAARKYGIATRDITLLPIGGLARLEYVDGRRRARAEEPQDRACSTPRMAASRPALSLLVVML